SPYPSQSEEPQASVAQQTLDQTRQQEDQTNAPQECADAAGEYKDEQGSPPQEGLYVPVHETGELLTLRAVNIDLNTGQGEKVLEQICVYLSAIRRVQYAWEQKTFVDDPYAIRKRAYDVEQYKKALFKFVGSGYMKTPPSTDQTTGAVKSENTMFVENMNTYLQDNREEVTNLFLNDLTSPSPLPNPDPNADLRKAIATNISAQESALKKIHSGQSDLLQDTLPADYSQFEDDFTKGGWNYWLIGSQPENTALGKQIIVEGELAYRQQQAAQNAREQTIAGQGFLPSRNCLDKDKVTLADKTIGCRTWQITAPAIITKESTAQGVQARLNELLNVSGAGQQVDSYLPTINETWDVTANQGNISTPGPDTPTPRPGTPIPGPGNDVTVNLTLNKVPNSSSKYLLKWATSKARECRTNNDWPITRINDTNFYLLEKGTSVGLTSAGINGNAIGGYLINTPLTFNMTIVRTRNNNNYDWSSRRLSSRNGTYAKTITYTPSRGDIGSNDYFSLHSPISIFNTSGSLSEDDFFIRVGGSGVFATSSNNKVNLLLQQFKNEINRSINANDNILTRIYQFGFGLDPNNSNRMVNLNATVRLSYAIECTGTNGSTARANVSLP
ncbi:MAG: hypothetical protein AAB645_02195, partial [Patescibacteria group bacterium]